MPWLRSVHWVPKVSSRDGFLPAAQSVFSPLVMGFAISSRFG